MQETGALRFLKGGKGKLLNSNSEVCLAAMVHPLFRELGFNNPFPPMLNGPPPPSLLSGSPRKIDFSIRGPPVPSAPARKSQLCSTAVVTETYSQSSGSTSSPTKAMQYAMSASMLWPH